MGQIDNEKIKKYDNGDKYDGNWKNGLRHGIGKLSYNDNSFY